MGPQVSIQNKRARFNYHVEKTFEAGIVLKGNEVKSIRNNQISLQESFVAHKHGEIFLRNCHITRYKFDNSTRPYNPCREKKLLLRKSQIKNIIGNIGQKGYSSFVLSCYLNERGLIKLQIGYGKGKKERDKRESIKERDWKKNKAKILKSAMQNL